MKKRLMVQVFLRAALAAPLSMFANSVQIQYQATSISGDEWSYTYTVHSAPFAANEAFTVFFAQGSYSNLQAAPPSPSRESKSFRRARSLSPSALGQLRSRHLHIGDYVGIPALFVGGIDCGCGIAVRRGVDHGGIRVQGACIQQ